MSGSWIGDEEEIRKGKLGGGCDNQEDTEEGWQGQADSEGGRLRHTHKPLWEGADH